MANREEELQKKREEAERKARRGEIDPTHEFTFQVIIISNFSFFLRSWFAGYQGRLNVYKFG